MERKAGTFDGQSDLEKAEELNAQWNESIAIQRLPTREELGIFN